MVIKTFTLDTNCLIAVHEARPEATSIRALASAHANGSTRVAVVAISASEKQKDGSHIQNFAEFRDRLNILSLGHLEILRPMAYFDVTFFDWCLFADSEMENLEREIHTILFPNTEFVWGDYCRANLIELSSQPSGKWRNCKCDVQAMWCHIYEKRNVFVTSDNNFHGSDKRAALVALGAGHIARPHDALLI